MKHISTYTLYTQQLCTVHVDVHYSTMHPLVIISKYMFIESE